MGRGRKSNWGVLAIFASVTFAALAYWIVSANEAPTLPYALAQTVLLGSVLVGMVDSFAQCRPARRRRIERASAPQVR
jgi:UDP-N-acetylmuramyl pentapeptide phosphotransferase/UDP-N-acetylglucosamine-1-phosphate transferase